MSNELQELEKQVKELQKKISDLQKIAKLKEDIKKLEEDVKKLEAGEKLPEPNVWLGLRQYASSCSLYGHSYPLYLTNNGPRKCTLCGHTEHWLNNNPWQQGYQIYGNGSLSGHISELQLNTNTGMGQGSTLTGLVGQIPNTSLKDVQ